MVTVEPAVKLGAAERSTPALAMHINAGVKEKLPVPFVEVIASSVRVSADEFQVGGSIAII